MECKSAHTEQCDKSRSLFKVVRSIFDIDSFEQQYVVIKGLLKSEKL